MKFLKIVKILIIYLLKKIIYDVKNKNLNSEIENQKNIFINNKNKCYGKI